MRDCYHTPAFTDKISHRRLFPRLSGNNVEEAFLETAQNIQDGSLDLNAAESGVQHKPSQQGGRGTTLTAQASTAKENCSC